MEMNLRKRMLPISANGQQPTELTFDWRAFEEGDYADYCRKMEHGLMYSGDIIGCIRLGDLCIDLSVYSLQQDGPIGAEDEAQLVLDFFVGGVDTGYAYGRNGYPYDNVEEAGYRFEDDKAGLKYDDFQKSIEDMIMLRIQQTEYSNADLIKKAADQLHIW